MGFLKDGVLGKQGSTVLMADGTYKLIENLAIGDMVLDAEGNASEVDGINISLLSSYKKLLRINDKLIISEDKPLLSINKKFHVFQSVELFNSKMKLDLRTYIVGKNLLQKKWSCWNSDYMDLLYLGNELKTVDGSEVIYKIEEIEHPEDFEDRAVYKHSTTNSGTYFVDGYCVASRINETWDYTNFSLTDGVVTIIHNTDTNNFERKVNLDLSTCKYPFWNYQKMLWTYY